MKKILCIGLAILSTFLLTACFSKKAISTEEFKSVLESNNFIVTNQTNTKYEYVEQQLIAKNNNYEIILYEMQEIDKAVVLFTNLQTELANSKSGASSESGSRGDNFATYILETNGKYKKLSRIDNTLIYLDVPVGYKEDAIKILESIGY